MDTLQELLDERDITRVLVRFAHTVDSKDYAGLAEVYTDDLTFNYGGGEQEGLDTLIDLNRRHLDVCAATQHLLGSIVIKVDGDKAESRSYVQARHQGSGDKAHLFFDTNGEYKDWWERRDVGWRIVRREATWSAHYGDPSVIGIG
ncbi:nuclear transport factor 2 family protein [Kineobactrum sediminis]|uniref:Nuclear transport factor 2 family protein n=1 Tax=Kineobactrum sediminis TaxID=1905677 RepID=A0A2N5Y276_9GAMM|nr:nuclear transport factor 2 family protein [Kineobactrum sediminis]PLW82500.1 nuclear transport factor 2 family protein [Kineobactrum sediminis]